LARLYILDGNYTQAVELLLKGLKLVQEDDSIKYVIFKNLGWARLQQKRYADAENNLLKAIAIDSEDKQRGSAHCLLAQVLEARGGKEENARQEWQKCVDFGPEKPSKYHPDEDQWIDMAKRQGIKRR
jgi:tetratricopeptide (TPR) repeat protein